MKHNTCVLETGKFRYAVHKPDYTVANVRQFEKTQPLGETGDNLIVGNEINFPEGEIVVTNGDWIFEVPNAFPFRGVTYIAKSWADEKAKDPTKICLPRPPELSLKKTVERWLGSDGLPSGGLLGLISALPEPLLLALASTSTDPEDLTTLAEYCCDIIHDTKGQPTGLRFKESSDGNRKPVIIHHQLFEVLVNNPDLPDNYKEVMVLRPGVQGGSEIVGDYLDERHHSHVYEYLRRNSYIPWGHYASNMAEDAVRYSVGKLSSRDFTGLRHLYYQRTYLRLTDELKIDVPDLKRAFSTAELEDIRQRIQYRLNDLTVSVDLKFNRSIWGWNYGYDFAPSEYRLHASHQQIHQQYAMVPSQAEALYSGEDHESTGEEFVPYACGSLVESFIEEYRNSTGECFFEKYIEAIKSNTRVDNDPDRESRLEIYSDDNVLVFVPKSQVSQWELQLITLKPVGNILEADSETRESIDRGILIAIKTLAALGARMITSIEYSKRFDADNQDMRFLISLLPKLPESPGAFSEAQLRWINGHYPEDFAIACRSKATEIIKEILGCQ